MSAPRDDDQFDLLRKVMSYPNPFSGLDGWDELGRKLTNSPLPTLSTPTVQQRPWPSAYPT
jgi:hypothetical protein